MRVEVELNIEKLWVNGPAVRPSSMAITFDSRIVEGMREVLADNPYLTSVESNRSLDWVSEGFEAKVQNARIVVSSSGGMFFRFSNAYTGAVYEYIFNDNQTGWQAYRPYNMTLT